MAPHGLLKIVQDWEQIIKKFIWYNQKNSIYKATELQIKKLQLAAQPQILKIWLAGYSYKTYKMLFVSQS